MLQFFYIALSNLLTSSLSTDVELVPICHLDMVNGESHSDCCRTVGDVLAHTLVTALEEKEARLDMELEYLDNLKDDDLEELRRKRLEEMKENHQRAAKLRSQGHGSYTELLSEKDFFEQSRMSKHVVCHFYRPSTWRCQIVDKHLQALAEKHLECRFLKINIEKSPYLAEKLRILMLPTIMLINEGRTEHSIIGFDEMGGIDDFETEALEEVLSRWGSIHKHK